MTDRADLPARLRLTPNQFAILRQAGGQIARPAYEDRRLMARDMAYLIAEGLIQRDMDDDQPTAVTTAKGDALLLTPESSQ